MTTERYGHGVSTTRRRRPALIALVIVAACGCLALGWWQWTRFQSASGTFQNLGYALQWPMFAWFCVYAYRKFVRYEEVPPEPSERRRRHRDTRRTCCPSGPKPVQQPSDDPALREYNAYLAELGEDTIPKNRTGPPHDHTRDHPEHQRPPPPSTRSAPRCSATASWRGRRVCGSSRCATRSSRTSPFTTRSGGSKWCTAGCISSMCWLPSISRSRCDGRSARPSACCSAGTIPLLGIIVEHFQTKDVKARFGV